MDNKKINNKDLINKFIELSSLVEGRNYLRDEIKWIEKQVQNVENLYISNLDTIQTGQDYIREKKSLLNFFSRKYNCDSVELIKTTGVYDTPHFDNVKKDYVEKNIELANELKQFAEINGLIITASEKIDEIWCEINELANNAMEYGSRDNYNALINIIFQKENVDLESEYSFLVNEILNHIGNINVDERIIKSANESQLRISQNMKGIININEISSTKHELIEKNKLFINGMNKKIEDVENSIINQFVSIVPSKYVLDIKFINYAIEALYYERCSTIGELLNIYENYELHEAANIKLGQIIKGLDNLHGMIFHSFLNLDNSLKQIEDTLSDINFGIANMNDSLNTINYSIQDAHYDNICNQEKILLSNLELSRSIQESNILASKQIDKLTGIDEGSREIAKNIYDVKRFTDVYRVEKIVDGKYYYFM